MFTARINLKRKRMKVHSKLLTGLRRVKQGNVEYNRVTRLAMRIIFTAGVLPLILMFSERRAGRKASKAQQEHRILQFPSC